MGFSLVGEGLLRSALPAEAWRPLISKLGYPLGFLVVVLGRQQLFTENTLTAVIPLLSRRDRKTFFNVARLWLVVFVANIVGALFFAWVVGNTEVFHPEVRQAFAEISREALEPTFWQMFLRGIFAGWLIALMVWLLPAAQMGRVSIIIITTYVIGLSRFPHIIAGSVEALYEVTTGEAPWGRYLVNYMVPVLLGNIVGGVALVSALKHAQVVAGRGEGV